MNQRQGVYKAVVAVLGEITGPVSYDSIPKSDLQKIHALVVQGILSGEIELRDRENKDQAWVVKYVPGLVNNWVRKDPNLNGGMKYEPKNPGSRQGSGDDSIKAMRALLAITTDPDLRVEIQDAISKRQAELRPAPKEINYAALPEHLRHLAPKSDSSAA